MASNLEAGIHLPRPTCDSVSVGGFGVSNYLKEVLGWAIEV